jgi:hypothetical protein
VSAKAATSKLRPEGRHTFYDSLSHSKLAQFPRVDTLDDGSDGDYDESDFLEPSIALWRLNLVALSQRENVRLLWWPMDR